MFVTVYFAFCGLSWKIYVFSGPSFSVLKGKPIKCVTAEQHKHGLKTEKISDVEFSNEWFTLISSFHVALSLPLSSIIMKRLLKEKPNSVK